MAKKRNALSPSNLQGTLLVKLRKLKIQKSELWSSPGSCQRVRAQPAGWPGPPLGAARSPPSALLYQEVLISAVFH